MLLNIGFKGKPVVERVIKILDLSFNWKLQPGWVKVAVELFFKNTLLEKQGVSEYSDRMEIIFSKKNKEKLAEELDISYNALANIISKLRKCYLGPSPVVSGTSLNKGLCKINPYKEDLSILINFNPSGGKLDIVKRDDTRGTTQEKV